MPSTITIIPAIQLRRGDVFSTDGYTVTSVLLIQGGGEPDEVAVQVSRDGHEKFAYLPPDYACPIWQHSRPLGGYYRDDASGD